MAGPSTASRPSGSPAPAASTRCRVLLLPPQAARFRPPPPPRAAVALAAYCGAYALWPEATEAIGKYGAYLSIANRQAEIMVRISAEFGFTPASRGRISMPKPEEPDPFDRLETPADPG